MQNNNLFVPIAIVVAGIIVAGTIYFTNGKSGEREVEKKNIDKTAETEKQNFELAPITDADHIRGDKNAPIKIVEFSDIECPFCKRLHSTLKQVLADYPGKVVWVYRHLPLEQLHPKAAFIEAHASECVASISGEEKFWEYLDLLYQNTPSNDRVDLTTLPKLAKQIGVDETKFNECQKSGQFNNKIQESIKQGIKAGAQGTPFSIIIGKDNSITPVSGAQPIENLKQIIDGLL